MERAVILSGVDAATEAHRQGLDWRALLETNIDDELTPAQVKQMRLVLKFYTTILPVNRLHCAFHEFKTMQKVYSRVYSKRTTGWQAALEKAMKSFIGKAIDIWVIEQLRFTQGNIPVSVAVGIKPEIFEMRADAFNFSEITNALNVISEID